MKPTKKIPLEWELNFDQTEIKKLEKKLLSGEITFEEWKKAHRKHMEERLSS